MWSQGNGRGTVKYIYIHIYVQYVFGLDFVKLLNRAYRGVERNIRKKKIPWYKRNVHIIHVFIFFSIIIVTVHSFFFRWLDCCSGVFHTVAANDKHDTIFIRFSIIFNQTSHGTLISASFEQWSLFLSFTFLLLYLLMFQTIIFQ